MGSFCNTLIVSLLTLTAATTAATADILCGRSVDFVLPDTSHHCLLHNSTVSAAATAVLHHSKVLGVLPLLHGQPLEIPVLPKESVLSLRSHLTACYTLLVGRCAQTVRISERSIRDAHQTRAKLEGHGYSKTQTNHHRSMLNWSVVGLLVLLPLVTASFLCCHSEGKSSQSMKSRTLSRKERKIIAASTDISINITDTDNPLGSDLPTTFLKSQEAMSSEKEYSPAVVSRASSPHSAPSLLEDPSAQSDQHLLESSLDIGTRDSTHGVKQCTSLSSMTSLGPRIPPEGCSLDSLTVADKPASPLFPSSLHQPLHIISPLSSVPPPPSHLRQHSTPVSLPPPLSPQLKVRPLTVVGEPTYSPRSVGPPLLPPKPNPHISSPPMSPVSLSESEALGPVKPGRVRPYRVVHQPSLSLSSLPHLPHSSDGTLCTQCGARLVADEEPLHLVESEPENTEAVDKLCQQCQTKDPHYHELEGSDDDISSSPPPIPHRKGSPEPGPLYERIGSIRRQHLISIRTDESHAPSKPHPPVPSPIHSPNPFTSSNTTCSLPSEDRHTFQNCPLPSEGAPLPPRPPTLGLVTERSTSDHNYESLPSTFGVDSPEDTMYAHITTPEAEPDSPPYIPENSQRAQMLKIDSQGYAEVVHKEEEEEEPNTPDPGYSPILPLSPASQPVASDYEVPVKIAPLPPSPSLLHPSPTHSRLSPIPVASPMPPFSNLDKVPASLPLPSEGHFSLSSSTAGPSLRRQGAMTENSLPLPTRTFHVLPHQDQDSLDTRRDSSGSITSYHLSYRLSNTSSGLGESMTESLRAIVEEEGDASGEESGQKTEPVIIKQKIYEVENRSRTKSYPNPEVRPPAGRDLATHKLKAQTMRIRISFNEDSQTV